MIRMESLPKYCLNISFNKRKIFDSIDLYWHTHRHTVGSQILFKIHFHIGFKEWKECKEAGVRDKWVAVWRHHTSCMEDPGSIFTHSKGMSVLALKKPTWAKYVCFDDYCPLPVTQRLDNKISNVYRLYYSYIIVYIIWYF